MLIDWTLSAYPPLRWVQADVDLLHFAEAKFRMAA